MPLSERNACNAINAIIAFFAPQTLILFSIFSFQKPPEDMKCPKGVIVVTVVTGLPGRQ